MIGSDIQKGLFGTANPVNQEMKIGRTTFRVIGVMEKQGGSFLGGPNFDRQVFIPITSYVKAFGGGPAARTSTSPSRRRAGGAGGSRVRRHRRDAQDPRACGRPRPTTSRINKLDTLVGTFNNVMGVVLLVGLLVTSISLFVGAVGVMNIMFVSVTERTREIGIRKAIGATRHSILLQFLFESSAICLLGGLIGIALAVDPDRRDQRGADAGERVRDRSW